MDDSLERHRHGRISLPFDVRIAAGFSSQNEHNQLPGCLVDGLFYGYQINKQIGIRVRLAHA
jgi:hypothetical protein